jgi:hypothetical protein
MVSVLTARRPPAAFLNALLAWAVLFPFVPALIRSTDTQPVFLLAFGVAALCALLLPHTGARLFRMSREGALFIAAAVAAATLSIVVGYILGTATPLTTRVFAFMQFCAAAAWAAYGTFRWRGRLLLATLLVYLAFTLVYFGTGGLVEDLLIGSRGEASESMLLSGRGARTLSPEPSFFALHVFNLCVLAHVSGAWREFGRVERMLFVGAACACMLASFSAYGAVLSLVVLGVAYPWIAVGVAATLAFLLGPVVELLRLLPEIRMVGIILALLEARGAIQTLVLLDASLGVRLESFIEYVRVFADRPLLGDGFSLYQGGGFISIVAALGAPAALFFLLLAIRIALGGFALGATVLACVWLLVNGTFGPVGIPALGVIAGSILASPTAHRFRPATGPVPHAAPVAET